MPGRRKTSMDIRELILQLRRSRSDRAVARASGVHRRTVKRYRQWASEQGLLAGALPGVEGLEALVQSTLPEKPPPQNVGNTQRSAWERNDLTTLPPPPFPSPAAASCGTDWNGALPG